MVRQANIKLQRLAMGLRCGALGMLWLSLVSGAVSAAVEKPVPDLTVTGAYIRGMPPGQSVTAAFLSLVNSSDRDYVLTAIAVPVAKKAEIHAHLHSGGMMQMRALSELTIAAHSTREFAPGGYHIMLFGVDRALRSGEKLPLTLTFASGEQLQVMASVRSVLDEAQ